MALREMGRVMSSPQTGTLCPPGLQRQRSASGPGARRPLQARVAGSRRNEAFESAVTGSRWGRSLRLVGVSLESMIGAARDESPCGTLAKRRP